MSRAFWIRIHRYAGLSLALFLMLAGLTGALLAFYPELDAALNSKMAYVNERAAPTLPVRELIQRVESRYPDARVSFTMLNRRPSQSVLMSVVGRREQPLGFTDVYVDPFDGRILGVREWGAVRFDRAHLMPFIYKLHYTLHLPSNWGIWLMGAVALIWMFDCIVGAYLTMPRGIPFFRRWSTAWQINSSRMTYDLHRAPALWAWLVLFTLAFTGVYFNLNAEVFKPIVELFGTVSPSPADSFTKLSSPRDPKLSIDTAVVQAHTLLSRSANEYVPWYAGYDPSTNTYQIAYSETGYGREALSLGNEQLFIDASTGQLKGRTGYLSGTAADRFMLWQYPLHSGQAFGLGGRILICITGLVVALLSLTGVMLWARKQSRSKDRATTVFGLSSTGSSTVNT